MAEWFWFIVIKCELVSVSECEWVWLSGWVWVFIVVIKCDLPESECLNMVEWV